MMTKKKILIGSIFAALLMVSMPFVSALQAPVKTSTTTTSVQPSNPTATITAADITNINSINSLASDLKTSLSNNPGTVTPEQMTKMIQMIILSRTVLNHMGYNDEFISQLAVNALKDKGYTIDAVSFNQQLQAVANSKPQPLCFILGVTLGIGVVITFVIGLIPIIGRFIVAPIAAVLLVIDVAYLLLCPPTQAIGCGCGDATGSTTPMQSN